MFDPMRQKTRENYFEVTFPDYPSIETAPYKVELIQSMGAHDIAYIHFPQTLSILIEGLSTGTPVKIRWKNDKVEGTFFGYKTDSLYKSSVIRQKRTVLTCFGASYPLKDNENKIWTNKTAPDIVKDIASKFNLKAVVTPHPIVWSQQSMAGHSWWEKIRELADRIGYAVQMQGSELHFHPVDKMIDRFLTSIPVLALLDSGAGFDTSYNGRTLEYFEPTIGDYTEHLPNKRAEVIIRGVDPVTGKVYTEKASPNKTGKNLKKKTKDPLFRNIDTRAVISSKSMAEQIAKAKAELSRLTISARGRGQGDPRIAPWRTVDIRQTESAATGLWVIKSVTHTILANQQYYVEFECLADGTQEQTSGDRASKGDAQPTVNIADALEYGTNSMVSSTTLNSQTLIVNQADTGFNVTPRRWETD